MTAVTPLVAQSCKAQENSVHLHNPMPSDGTTQRPMRMDHGDYRKIAHG
jgi:hypothetical protein